MCQQRRYGPGLLDANHPTQAYSLLALAESVLRRGRPAEAEQLARDALAVREIALPPDHWLASYTRAFLGECLFDQGKFEAAEPLIIDSAQRLIDARGYDDKYTQLTLRRASRLYEAWGRPEQATKYASAGADGDAPGERRQD